MYKHRIKILLLAAAMIAAVLLARLADLQIRNAAHFEKVLTEQQKAPYKPIPPKRGRILTADGTELVTNKPAFELAVFYGPLDPDPQWINAEIWRLRQKLRRQKPLTLYDRQIQQRWEKIRDVPNSQRRTKRRQILKDLRQEEFGHLLNQIAQLADLDRKRFGERCEAVVKIIQKRIKAVESRRKPDELTPEGRLRYPIAEQRMFHPILTDLDHDTAVRLRLALADHRWIQVRPSSSRHYPQGQTLCHILGRTTRQGGPQETTTQPATDHEYLPGEAQGRSGLEQAYNHILRGQRGWLELDDPPVIDIQPRDGDDLVLTIDLPLQKFAEHQLQQRIDELPYATAGAAVVLDLRNHALLALASVPTYDPNEYYKNKNYHAEINADRKHQPYRNHALNAQHPPGSIVKPLVAQIAFDHNHISPTTTMHCTGRLDPAIKAYQCWKPTGHGNVDPVRAISESCDVFFYKTGERIGARTLATYYRTFGVGSEPMGMTLPCSQGTVPTDKSVQKAHGRSMGTGDARNLAVGQGDLEISPLQAAVMLATLLTGKRHGVSLTKTPPTDDPVELNLSRSHLNLIRKGMEDAITTGTGKYAYTDQIRLAGKTGSAQVTYLPTTWRVTYITPDTQTHALITETPRQAVAELLRQNPRIKNIRVRVVRDKRLVALKDPNHPDETTRPAHAWFIAYAPAPAPRIVIVVFIEFGLSGGSAAGPVVKALALKTRELGYLP